MMPDTSTSTTTFVDTSTVDTMIAQAEQQAARQAGVPSTRVLDDVRAWFGRFLRTVAEEDIDLLTLWAAHTHLIREVYSTPRLLIDSPVPGSGKTTALEHLQHLALRPVQMASISSPAMLARLLDDDMRTLLIDEADRTLRPDNPGTPDVLSILNSGYKIGGTRPVLVPDKDKGWVTREMPTYSPVAMAGNNPVLPEDTRSRTIRVLLLPDLDGTVEESDWELIEPEAEHLATVLAAWADHVRDQVAATRPPMPEGITGRFREKWQPLKRVAVAAGGTWPERVDRMALADKEQVAADREDGMVVDRPHIVLLQHLAEVWPLEESFVSTSTLLDLLIDRAPEHWGDGSPFGKALTAKRLGKMLATSYKVNSKYETSSHVGPKGYRIRDLSPVMGRMGMTLPPQATQGPQSPQATHAGGDDRHLGDLGELPSGGVGNAPDPALCTVCGEPLADSLIAAGDTAHWPCEAA